MFGPPLFSEFSVFSAVKLPVVSLPLNLLLRISYLTVLATPISDVQEPADVLPLGPMSSISILWSMAAAAAVTLGGIHFGVWIHERKSLAHLLFAIVAFSVAGVAVTEVKMM